MERWEEIIEQTKLPRQDQKVYIWGAGNTAVLNHQGMLRADLYRELRVEAFWDSGKAGQSLFGFPVLSPDVLETEKPGCAYVLICSTAPQTVQEIRSLCCRKGITAEPLEAVILKLRHLDFLDTVELLDPASKAIYHQILENRAVPKEVYSSLFAGESYFGIPEFCRPYAKDIIVDCGAYVGDSAERFLWRMDKFRQYIAIEPDRDNFRAMEKRFARLRAEWNLSEEKLKMHFGGVDRVSASSAIRTGVDGLASIASEAAEGEETVPFWAIDDLLPEGFTFLKADIESYEYRMLLGAKKSIRKHHPRMAICIYHNMVDMFSIPQLIHRIDPSYRLAVRHHSYGFEETVLYAY